MHGDGKEAFQIKLVCLDVFRNPEEDQSFCGSDPPGSSQLDKSLAAAFKCRADSKEDGAAQYHDGEVKRTGSL